MVPPRVLTGKVPKSVNIFVVKETKACGTRQAACTLGQRSALTTSGQTIKNNQVQRNTLVSRFLTKERWQRYGLTLIDKVSITGQIRSTR